MSGARCPPATGGVIGVGPVHSAVGGANSCPATGGSIGVGPVHSIRVGGANSCKGASVAKREAVSEDHTNRNPPAR